MDQRRRVHNKTIVEQFGMQAVPFARMPGHAESMALLLELCEANRDDEALDVACGPGLVACSLAPAVRHVTGIDITPAMVAEARRLQAERGLVNVSLTIGDANPLPFADESFSLVLTRYSFHHLLDPQAVLAEMIRVCRRGGRVMVVDPVLPPEKVVAYNRMERLRDPSHVHALSIPEMAELISDSGLRNVRTGRYKVEMELETVLGASFPNPGDGDKVREIFRADVGKDRLGVDARRIDGAIHFTYPILAIVGVTPNEDPRG